MGDYLVLSSLVVLLLVGPAAAQSNAHASTANCIGSDADTMEPEAREAVCLRELGGRAYRTGSVLSLTLDNGTSRIFRSNPKACKDDLAEKCVNYRLVGFLPAAGRYLVLVTGYESSECRLVSARTGRATKLFGLPHFAPDGSTFFVTGVDNAYDSWIGIGTIASDPPALMWKMGSDPNHSWKFLRWIDDVRVALIDTARSEACPNGNCDALLSRSGTNAWTLERSFRNSDRK